MYYGCMPENIPPTSELVQTLDEIISLGDMALRLGREDRITLHPDGVMSESVTDHTIMLSVIACSLAARYAPDMDIGRVAQFALVHDFPEVYAGDTPTLTISEEERQQKETREAEALERIDSELPRLNWLTDTVRRYETLEDKEARFVKALDKLMPTITHILNKGAYIHREGYDIGRMSEIFADQPQEMRPFTHDQELVLIIRELLVDRAIEEIFPSED